MQDTVVKSPVVLVQLEAVTELRIRIPQVVHPPVITLRLLSEHDGACNVPSQRPVSRTNTLVGPN